MKTCPGLQSGIDRSSSLSLVIRGIPSSIRPPIRHSGEGRNPGGVGRGKTTRRWKKPTHRPIFIPLCGLRKAIGVSGDQKHAPYPDTGPESRGVGRGDSSAGTRPQPRSRRPASPSFPRKPESRRGGRATPRTNTTTKNVALGLVPSQGHLVYSLVHLARCTCRRIWSIVAPATTAYVSTIHSRAG